MEPIQQDNVALDPISVGLRLGTAGAAVGLGYAALHRMIAARHDKKRHISMLKPMLAGATIGMALGTGMAVQRWRQKMPTKYAALINALEKKAVFDSYSEWGERHPFLSLGAYTLPGVGAGMSSADAAHSLGQGKYLSALGNAAMIPLGLVGLGGIAKALPGMARVARVARAGKGVGRGGVRQARTLLEGTGGLAREGLWDRTWQNLSTKLFQKPLANAAPADLARWSSRGQKLEDILGVGRKFKALQGVPLLNRMTGYGATTIGGLGLGIAGGLREGDSNSENQAPRDMHGQPYGTGSSLMRAYA